MLVSFPSDCGRRRQKGDSHDRSQRAALRCVPPQSRATAQAREGITQSRQGRKARGPSTPARRRLPSSDRTEARASAALHRTRAALRELGRSETPHRRHGANAARARRQRPRRRLPHDAHSLWARLRTRAARSRVARRLQRPHQSLSARPGHRHSRLARAARTIHRRRHRPLPKARLCDRARGRARRGTALSRSEPRLLRASCCG